MPPETPTASPSTEKHTRWSVLRKKSPNGACYPIRLTYPTPVSEAELREQIQGWVKEKKEEWKGFKHFDVWPTT